MMELNNTQLEQLIKENQSQETILNEMEKTTIIVPVNAHSKDGIKDPLGFNLEQIDHEYTAEIPVYTNYELAPSENTLELNIIDLARLLWDAEGKYRNVKINPNTDSYAIPINDILDHFYETLYCEEILRLEADEEENQEAYQYILDLLREASATLQEDYYLYLREGGDGIISQCGMDSFISFAPLVASANHEYRKDLPHFNVLSMKKGNKVLPLAEIDDYYKDKDENILIAPGTQFKLIEELEDGTKVWECVEQMFYKEK